MMTDEEVVVGALRRRIGLGLIAVVAFEVISLRGCLGEERVWWFALGWKTGRSKRVVGFFL
jgi:hypothetical protein